MILPVNSEVLVRLKILKALFWDFGVLDPSSNITVVHSNNMSLIYDNCIEIWYLIIYTTKTNISLQNKNGITVAKLEEN